MTGIAVVMEAVAHGKAGPSQALVNVQVIWQLILEIAIHQKYPGAIQIVGMAVGILGAIVIGG